MSPQLPKTRQMPGAYDSDSGDSYRSAWDTKDYMRLKNERYKEQVERDYRRVLIQRDLEYCRKHYSTFAVRPAEGWPEPYGPKERSWDSYYPGDDVVPPSVPPDAVEEIHKKKQERHQEAQRPPQSTAWRANLPERKEWVTAAEHNAHSQVRERHENRERAQKLAHTELTRERSKSRSRSASRPASRPASPTRSKSASRAPPRTRSQQPQEVEMGPVLRRRKTRSDMAYPDDLSRTHYDELGGTETRTRKHHSRRKGIQSEDVEYRSDKTYKLDHCDRYVHSTARARAAFGHSQGDPLAQYPSTVRSPQGDPHRQRERLAKLAAVRPDPPTERRKPWWSIFVSCFCH